MEGRKKDKGDGAYWHSVSTYCMLGTVFIVLFKEVRYLYPDEETRWAAQGQRC
jgi:hypothetical protein